MMTTDSRDIVERLRKSRFLGRVYDETEPNYERIVHHDDLRDEDNRLLSDLLNDAADYITRLRSIAGKADVGQSFREIADKHGLQTGAPND